MDTIIRRLFLFPMLAALIAAQPVHAQPSFLSAEDDTHPNFNSRIFKAAPPLYNIDNGPSGQFTVHLTIPLPLESGGTGAINPGDAWKNIAPVLPGVIVGDGKICAPLAGIDQQVLQ